MITITTDKIFSLYNLSMLPNKNKDYEIKGEMNNSSSSPIKLLNKGKHQIKRAI